MADSKSGTAAAKPKTKPAGAAKAGAAKAGVAKAGVAKAGVAKAGVATAGGAKAKPVPVVKAPGAAKAPARGKAEPAAAPAVRTRVKKVAGIPPEQRRNYVEVAAYHIAERRGFAAGDPLQDWVQAEAEIDRLLAAGRLGNAAKKP